MHLSYNNSNSQLRITVTKGPEILGYLVIDSIIGGHSYGGVRLMPKIDEKEIGILARAMTLKFGFLGLPHGGAKAGVIGDPDAPQEERLARLEAFGQAISPLLAHRVYIPATDMGTYNKDILHMVKSIGMPIKKREFTVERSGYYTALTVFSGIKQAARHVGMDVSDCRIAIEGLGKVGTELARILHDAGAPIVAVSTSRGAIYNPEGLDIIRLTQLASETGSRAVEVYDNAEPIDLPSLIKLPVDILCPCALINTINAENADRVFARIISPGANNPVSPEAEPILHRRGIISLPYFMTNCGGTLGGTMEFASVNKNRIEEFIDIHIGNSIAKILEEAAGKGLPPIDLAVPFVLKRLKDIGSKSAHPTVTSRLFKWGLELYRSGYIPGFLAGPLAPGYFEKIFMGNDMEKKDEV